MKPEFTYFESPIGKPRMTRRDKWKLRPCVVAYRSWCDGLRDAAGIRKKIRLTDVTALIVKAYFPFPKSWSQAKRNVSLVHLSKPDCDNILKAVMDALFENDEMVFSVSCQKVWEDMEGPRVHVRVVTL